MQINGHGATNGSAHHSGHHSGQHSGTPLTVAVTGASGFVGRHIVRELLGRGHHVRALVRSRAKAASVLAHGQEPRAELIVGDVLDGRSADALVRGADAVIHLIGIIREASGGQTFERMHVEATRAVVEACRGASVRRYLHMSALGASPDASSAYARTKFAAERIVRGAGTELRGETGPAAGAWSLDWTIFRPGLILGAGGEFTEMMMRWSQGRRMPWLFMPYFSRLEVDLSKGSTSPVPTLRIPNVAPVAVEDVAEAFVGSMTNEASFGEVYNLVGPERLSFRDMLLRVRDKTPQSRPDIGTFGIPGSLAAAQAWAFGAIGLGGMLPFDAGMALMGQQDAVASDRKAEEHLGFRPRAAL